MKDFFLLILLLLSTQIFAQQKNGSGLLTKKQLTTIHGDTVSSLGKNIDFIFQDQTGNLWFASNGEGVFVYNGKSIIHISEKQGLCSNFVLTIRQDSRGDFWFSTRGGVCRFDGTQFVDYSQFIKTRPFGNFHYKKGGLFFNHLDGVCFYDGGSFTNFVISPPGYSAPSNNLSRPYSVYSTLVDKDGNLWFGTESKGVCKYDGKSFSYLTEKGLSAAAIRTIYQDSKGVLWFGNNGAGLFRYDGETLTNLTEERGLGNPEFLKGHFNNKPGSLARVWAINEDGLGNLWIGTIDAGLWKFDGSSLTNYTTQNGLADNAIWVIFKDRKGELLFVTNGNAINIFNGQTFSLFSF